MCSGSSSTTSTTKVGGRHRPHLNVVVDHDDLQDEKPGRTLGGVPLPGLDGPQDRL